MKDVANIIELPLEFQGRGEVKGYDFKQIRSSEFAYIYEVLATNGCKWYEVFTKRVNTRYGVISYPGSKQFGINAWTCKTFERAEERYNQLNSRVKTSEGNNDSDIGQEVK